MHNNPVNAIDPTGMFIGGVSNVTASIAIGAVLANIGFTVAYGVKNKLSGLEIAGNVVANLGFFMLIIAALMGGGVAAGILLGVSIVSAGALLYGIIKGHFDYIDLLLIAGQIATFAIFAGAASSALTQAGLIWESPQSTNFSQKTMSKNNYAEQMRNGEWNWKRPGTAIERVITKDGRKVSLDNRRLAAAKGTGQTKVPFVDHKYSDPLPSKWLNDSYWMKHGCKTWGDILNLRLGRNNLPPNGTATPPTAK